MARVCRGTSYLLICYDTELSFLCESAHMAKFAAYFMSLESVRHLDVSVL